MANPANQNIEETFEIKLDFTKLQQIGRADMPVIPAIVQDKASGKVLLLAYVNQEALDYSLKNRIAAFYSTSRKELWVKGLTSGDMLEVVEIRVNCEQNSLLYLVRLKGEGSCHTKLSTGKHRHNCYYRKIEGESLRLSENEPDK